MSLSVCGAFLAAGPDLWLIYGEPYVFAASAAFVDTRLEGLVGSLSLIPIKVFQAAELILTSIQSTRFCRIVSNVHACTVFIDIANGWFTTSTSHDLILTSHVSLILLHQG
jgi:hypothetical protein